MHRRRRRDDGPAGAARRTPARAVSPEIAAVLEAQRGAGNHAVARVLARDANPKLEQEKRPPPKTAGEVDAVFDASAYFKDYVGGKIGKGARAGKGMTFDDEGTFAKAWVRYAVGKDNPKTGQPFTPEVAERWLMEGMKAFEDTERGEIHIRAARADGGTPLHEGLHFFSNADWKGTAGYQLNEGVTEFFTRKLCEEAAIERDANTFIRPLNSVGHLVKIVGEPALGKAYFNGSPNDLWDPVDEAKGKGTWLKWLSLLEHGEKFKDANELLTGVKTATPSEAASRA